MRRAPARTIGRCPPSRSCPPSARPATSRRPSPPWREGVRRGDHYQTLEGITGSGKTATIAWTIEAGPAPDPDHRAQQVPGRPAVLGAARAVPQEPGGVLRLLLRLLPARGLPAHHRHLHREGLVDQRRDRPAAPRHHLVAAHAARRDRGGLGLVHLRPGLARGVPRPDPGHGRGRGARPAGAAAPAGRPAVRPQRHQPGPGHLPGPGRHGGDPPRLRGAARCGWSSSATPSSGSSPSTCSPARWAPRWRTWWSSPPPTTWPARRPSSGPSAPSRSSCASGSPASSSEGKLLEAQRLRVRTEHDLEMLAETGVCSGIENYSRHLDGRSPGEPPFTLLDFFPKDYLVVVDESHVAIPQLHGQWAGDRSRKDVLVEHGFRLPSAIDNRPLRFEEFVERVPQAIFVSATPGPLRARALGPDGRAGDPAHRPGRPRGGGPADQGPGGRPHGPHRRGGGAPAGGCW